MKNKYQTAAQKLHNFISEDADLTDAEVVECLKAEGVNVQHFLERLGKVSGRAVKQPTTTERLRALANRAGSRVKTLFAGEDNVASFPHGMAYGRQGKSKERQKTVPPSDKNKKQ